MNSPLFTVLILFTLSAHPAAGRAEEATFRWVDEPGSSSLLLGNAPVLKYVLAHDTASDQAIHDTYKVFHHVFGPVSGEQITKGPGGKFTHHRGLFVGWNRTKTENSQFDFWHCKNGAHLKHVEFLERTSDAHHGGMTAEIHWNDADGQAVIREFRSVTVRPLKINQARAWQVDWSTQLESQRGTIKLNGDRQHAGFQFRAAQPVADAESAVYIRPAGFPTQTEAVQVSDKNAPNGHINLNWFAMHYPLGETEYTIEYFEAPGQPQPSRYSERPYGRFGAFYDATIETDQPLSMRYRLIISEGPSPARTEIQRRYNDFVTELKVQES